MVLASVPPLALMLALSTGVIAWQHAVSHTYTTAQSMHLAPLCGEEGVHKSWIAVEALVDAM